MGPAMKAAAAVYNRIDKRCPTSIGGMDEVDMERGLTERRAGSGEEDETGYVKQFPETRISAKNQPERDTHTQSALRF